MASLFEEVIALLGKLPVDLVKGVILLLQTLVLAKSEEDQRKALDEAMAAAERIIVEKEFPG